MRNIITIQEHVDHVGGVQYFRDRNPRVQYIARAGNAEHQILLQSFRARRSAFRFWDAFVEDFAYYAEQGYTAINLQDSPTADTTFAIRDTLTFGGLQLELIVGTIYPRSEP